MAGAMAPPAGGFLSTLCAEFAGRLFGRLYVLKAAEAVKTASGTSSTDVAQRNLAVLSKAVAHMEKGDVRNALIVLETLTGECRSRAASWIADARHALLLQQGARAVAAKARCLNTLLLSPQA